MIVAMLLALYAALGVVALPRLLSQVAWFERAPRLAIAMWQAACASVVVSALLAALAVAVPASVLGHGLADFFEACATLLSHGVPFTSASARIALLLAGVLVVRITYCAACVLLSARRERRRHAEMLAIVGRHDSRLGAMVVDYDECMAYCLPGRHGLPVITTGALRTLTSAQTAAVLAHEHAHLRGRHHLVLAAVRTLVRAFSGAPLFARASSEIARLVELLADDVAARGHPRVHIAAALVGLATGRVPDFALGAGGETALVRVRRLLDPVEPLRQRERLVGILTIGVLLAGPAAVAAMPGVRAFLAHYCESFIF
ncbi:hypothetical protein Misp01_67130 [Microtetraspora sp. NBRC 13810]|uniref:M56 family metallopeptidase n=1 Tax=Microtetraspora sp. NBRC 13810 TaxID=3030990 RepID=UPI0024A58AC6|nr:M56 family metallopeptidase [Microtetraspora sp. NBRC 13810]GLW11585.1 hypothetical protein Misp01_67130 [Microtetraspora sp. NBRC 13810]